MKKGALLLACLSTLALVVFNTSAQTVVPKGEYVLSIGETGYNTNVDHSGTHWFWSAQDRKLTLSGYDGGAIRCTEAFTVELEDGSHNQIDVTADNGLYGWGTVSLIGSGSLKISGTKSQASNSPWAAVRASGILVDGATLDLSGFDYGLMGSYGGTSVKDSSTSCSDMEVGIYGTTVNFIGGSVTITGGDSAVKAWSAISASGTTFHIKNTGIGFDAYRTEMVTTYLTLDGVTADFEGCDGAANIITNHASYASSTVNISHSNLTVKNGKYGFSVTSVDFIDSMLKITGCSGLGISSRRWISLKGGCDFTIRSAGSALYASGAQISATDRLDLVSGAGQAIESYSITLNGQRATIPGGQVLIENGTVVPREDVLTQLIIGDIALEGDQVAGDASGAGWTWSGADRTLTLEHYNGGGIAAVGGSIELVVNSTNAIDGDLLVSKARILGSGSLTATGPLKNNGLVTIEDISFKCRFVNSAGDLALKNCLFETESRVKAGAVSVEGGSLTLWGDQELGSFTAKNATITLTGVSDACSLAAKNDVSLSVCTYNGKGGISAGGDLSLENVTASDLSDGYRTLYATGDIAIYGGTAELRGDEYAISTPAGAVSITGKANLRLEGKLGAFNARKVTLNGEPYIEEGLSLQIVDGVIKNSYSRYPALLIDDTVVYADQVDKDYSSDHWRWSGTDKALILSDYDSGRSVTVDVRGAKLVLASGTVNHAETLYCKYGLTVTGPGSYSGRLSAEDTLTITGGAKILAHTFSSDHDVIFKNATLKASSTVNLWASLTLIDSYMECLSVSAYNLTFTRSTILTTQDDPDDLGFQTDGKLSLTDSVLLFYSGEYRKLALKGSLLLQRVYIDELDAWFYVLIKSAKVTQTFTLPTANYYIPKGVSLSAAKGARVVFQGTLLVDGKVSGDVACPGLVETIAIDGPDTVTAGRTAALKAVITPDAARKASLEWTSANPTVATVDGNGIVTGLNVDVPTPVDITVTSRDEGGKSAAKTVTVMPAAYQVILKKDGAELGKALTVDFETVKAFRLEAEAKPASISQAVVWSTSDKKIATVAADGNVKLLKPGSATLTATATDGSGAKGSVKLTVTRLVGKIEFNGPDGLIPGASAQLSAVVTPGTAYNKAVVWTSSDPDVMTVDKKGTVTVSKTAVPGASAAITATAADGSGVSASRLLSVTQPVTAIVVTSETSETYVNYKGYLQLNAAVSPATASGGVTWKSSNISFVTADANGKVYGKKVGRATVYAIAADGTGVRGQITIQVITPVMGVRLPETEKIFIGQTKKLAVTLTPSAPTFTKLTWKSNNEAVATVDEATGLVTAVAAGEAVITTTAYNGLSDSCTVTVTLPVIEIDVSADSPVLYKGQKTQLNMVVSPDDAGDKGLIWTPSSTKNATVDSQGLVTGKSAGKVKITATAKDGSGVSGSVTLTVASPEKAITLDRTSAVLYQNGETDALRSLKLTAAASPKGSAFKALTWSVENGETVAAVDENGVVTVLAEGTAVIRATSDNGHPADCAVTVRTLPTSFEFTTKEKTLAFKQSFNLGAEATFDAGCTEPALTWSTDNKKVATVSSTGVVKASKNKTGKATITAITKNGIKATCVVTVVRSLPKAKSSTANAREALPLITLRLSGSNYTTSDAKVADVAKNGAVTPGGDGKAVLEAGGKRITVKVSNGNPTELTLDEGAELTLVSDADIKWMSENDRIAAVDKDGSLTALREGETYVSGETSDGRTVEIWIIVRLPETAQGENPTQTAESEPAVSQPSPSPEPEPSADPEPSTEPSVPEEPDSSGQPSPFDSRQSEYPSASEDRESEPQPEKESDQKADTRSTPMSEITNAEEHMKDKHSD